MLTRKNDQAEAKVKAEAKGIKGSAKLKNKLQRQPPAKEFA